MRAGDNSVLHAVHDKDGAVNALDELDVREEVIVVCLFHIRDLDAQARGKGAVQYQPAHGRLHLAGQEDGGPRAYRLPVHDNLLPFIVQGVFGVIVHRLDVIYDGELTRKAGAAPVPAVVVAQDVHGELLAHLKHPLSQVPDVRAVPVRIYDEIPVAEGVSEEHRCDLLVSLAGDHL